MARNCDICGRTHRKLTRRQCLLGGRRRVGQLELAWRAAIDGRDGAICQKCGQGHLFGDNLQHHHIIRRGKCLRLKFDIENGLTLCAGCHIWWHQTEFESLPWFAQTWPERQAYLSEKLAMYRQDPGTVSMAWLIDQLECLRSQSQDFTEGKVQWEPV